MLTGPQALRFIEGAQRLAAILGWPVCHISPPGRPAQHALEGRVVMSRTAVSGEHSPMAAQVLLAGPSDAWLAQVRAVTVPVVWLPSTA